MPLLGCVIFRADFNANSLESLVLCLDGSLHPTRNKYAGPGMHCQVHGDFHPRLNNRPIFRTSWDY